MGRFVGVASKEPKTMANTRALVKRRKSVKNTRKITKTMEMVSTAKLMKAQNQALAARPYARKLQEVIRDLAASSSDTSHPLLEVHDTPKRAVVIVLTADRGLCGAYNANILKKERELARTLKERGFEIEYVVQGKKGLAAFRFIHIQPRKIYEGVSNKPDYLRAEEIAQGLIERYSAREIDEAYLVFSRFQSMVTQTPTIEKIMPLTGLGSEKAGAADKGDALKAAGRVDYLFHPEPRRILSEVLPLVVKMSIFTAMLDHTAGEHAARRLAMKNATDAADEMIKMLTRKYNRARQGKITQEIAEIVGGAAALE